MVSMVAVWAQVCKPVSDYKKRQERREEAIPGAWPVLLPLAQDSAMSFKVETDIGWAKDSFLHLQESSPVYHPSPEPGRVGWERTGLPQGVYHLGTAVKGGGVRF